jgi:hypothetical protein
VPAANKAGNFATIWALDDDTRVNVAESSFTTGAPVAVRLAPVMVICLVAEFMMALTMVGVCAWAKAAEQISQAMATPDLRIVSIDWYPPAFSIADACRFFRASSYIAQQTVKLAQRNVI